MYCTGRLSIWAILAIVLTQTTISGQDPAGNYNPYVNQGIIDPSPLWPVEQNGSGEISFNVGNTGSDALDPFAGEKITLTITLTSGVPGGSDPVSAISGSSASLFTWSYHDGVYTGIQVSPIPPMSSGNILIAYRVTENSAYPGSNGFSAVLTPAPYQEQSNSENDDQVSSYTYTDLRDYSDAPETYGSAYHSLDFENYLGSLCDPDREVFFSPDADGDDLDGLDDEEGVLLPKAVTQGEQITVPVEITGLGRLNAWADWNNDGDFDDPGEYIVNNLPGITGSEDLLLNIPAGATISDHIYLRFRFSPGTINKSYGSAAGGEVEDYFLEIQASHHTPGAPTDLTADFVSEYTVKLSWTPPAEGGVVDEYRIYRDGLIQDSSVEPGYTDLSVFPGDSYSYTVTAVNSEGYESAHSEPLIVFIEDTTSTGSLIRDLSIFAEGHIHEAVIGKPVRFYAEILPQNAEIKEILWRISEYTGTARITQTGILIGESEGAVNVVAIAMDGSGTRDTMEFSILEPVLVDDIELSSATGEFRVQIGDSLQLFAEVVPETASDRQVSWLVENISGEATVSQNGLLNTLAEGLVHVFASSLDGSGIQTDHLIHIVNWPDHDALYDAMEFISVYPNPSHGNLFVKLSDIQVKRIQIIDLKGILLEDMPLSSGREITVIPVTGLSPGTYFLKAISDTGVTLKKIIVIPD